MTDAWRHRPHNAALVAALLSVAGLGSAACGSSVSSEPTGGLPEPRTCVSLGNAVASAVDWSPNGELLAVLIDYPDGSRAVASVRYPGGALVELERSGDVLPFAIAADAEGAVLWQRAGEDGATLVRSAERVETWSIGGHVLELDATDTSLVASRMAAIGLDATDYDLVRLTLRQGAPAEMVSFERIRGLSSFAITPDGSATATAAQAAVGEPIRFEVRGPRPWSREIDDAVGYSTAVSRDGDRLLYSPPSTGSVLVLSRTDEAARVVAAHDVLAFDLSEASVLATTSRNITGGAGELCLVDGAVQ